MSMIRIILLLLTVSNVYAFINGHETGNGGDAVVCKSSNGEITSVEFYDYYEMTNYYHYQLNIEGSSYYEIVKNTIERIKNLSPKRYQLYLKWLEEFEKDIHWLEEGDNLVDIPDSNHEVYPQNCELKQIVIQKKPSWPINKRYLIDTDLWNQLNDIHRALLVLHEIIYREAIEFGAVNSVKARIFNAILSSTEFDNYNKSLLNFIDLLRRVKLGTIEVDRITYRLFTTIKDEDGSFDFDYPLTFYHTGQVEWGWAKEGQYFEIINPNFSTYIKEINIYLGGYIQFLQDGSLHGVRLINNYRTPGKLTLKDNTIIHISNTSFSIKYDAKIWFHRNKEDFSIDLKCGNINGNFYKRNMWISAPCNDDRGHPTLIFKKSMLNEIRLFILGTNNYTGFTIYDPLLKEMNFLSDYEISGDEFYNRPFYLKNVAGIRYQYPGFDNTSNNIYSFAKMGISSNPQNYSKYLWTNPINNKKTELYLINVIYFYPNKILKSAKVKKSLVFIQKKNIEIVGDIIFYQSGHLKECILNNKYTLKQANHWPKEFDRGTKIKFNKKGQVMSFTISE